jgi:hypothetical protein
MAERPTDWISAIGNSDILLLNISACDDSIFLKCCLKKPKVILRGSFLIISDDLRKKLKPDSHFQIKTLGQNELRGRDEKIELFTILTT